MIALIVDDSEVNLTVYRGVLSRLPDLEVVTFASPIAALAWAERELPDVAIIDYHMPELDGLEFIQRYRAVPGNDRTLVIMVTADAEREVRHKALDYGSNDFLTKPIDRVEFMARMKNMLALSKSRQQLADHAAWLKEEVDKATADIVQREIETIVRLTRAAEFRDDVTGMHVIRVGHMCATLARVMGLPEDECKMLLLAAPMHDIGKVATPDAVLLKPGPLTKDEFEVMKQHTIAGYEILRDSNSPMLRAAAEIALTHHERFDGAGYPRGLAGTEIPLYGRICAVVDVFDALTSVRPYKTAWPIDQAIRTLDQGRGTQFDPDLIEVFHEALGEIIAIKRRFSDQIADVSTLKTTFA